MRHKTCRSVALLGFALLALAGCGKKDPAGAAKLADAAGGKVAVDTTQPRAGEWETHILLEKIEMPDMPERMRAMVESSKGKERVGKSCLTPEQVAASQGAMFKQTAPGCTYEKFSMGGGHVEAKLHCVNQMGNRTTQMAGDYQADSYTLHVTNSGAMASGKAISTSMTITGRRTGECTAASMQGNAGPRNYGPGASARQGTAPNSPMMP